MSWERRKHSGGRYYTRSRRVRGRILREYVGTGEVAELCARLDALEREERAIEAEMDREGRGKHAASYAALFGPLDVLDAACSALMRRDLEAAGYHLHKRGEWRKKRERRENGVRQDGE